MCVHRYADVCAGLPPMLQGVAGSLKDGRGQRRAELGREEMVEVLLDTARQVHTYRHQWEKGVRS